MGTAEMTWNAPSHLNIFTTFKGLSHLVSRNHSFMTWAFPGKNTFFLVLNRRKTHKDSMWGARIPLYFTCEHWTAPTMHCWGWMVIADSKFSCWHDNSRSGATVTAAAEGEMAALCFPLLAISASTIWTMWNLHICTACMCSSRQQERERMGPTELGLKQRRKHRRSCRGEEGRRFINVALADNSSPSVRDAWRSP